jgi:carboxypeptidase C (cathepsin A)
METKYAGASDQSIVAKAVNLILITLLFCPGVPVHAQSKWHHHSPASKGMLDSLLLTQPEEAITSGTATVEGNRIDYKAVAGTIILKNKNDKPTCSMFYVAYFKSGVADESERPITFLYNGGPGSSSIWLHMAAWGPKCTFLEDTERVTAPYKTVNNDYSLLDASDLVFIDAPGTGFSKVLTKDKGGFSKPNAFYGIDPDAQAFARFITDFLSQFDRWDSPKYLFGESYGTLRSAALAGILETQDNVDLNGVILLSQMLDVSNMTDYVTENPGNDLAFELALPSCAATAWYYHKLPDQPERLQPFLESVEQFAMNDYALALNKGSLLDSTTFRGIAEKLHQYTGLPVSYIIKANLRITGYEFEKTLLSKSDRVTGRLDTRYSGPSMDPLGEYPLYDPQSAVTSSAIISTFNNYVRKTLRFDPRIDYIPGTNAWATWDYRHHAVLQAFGDQNDRFFANVMPDLASAMIYNPKLKVMLNMGYFDLATPFFEGLYEMHHLPMPVSIQNNITYAFYKSGHMVYMNHAAHKELHDNVAAFIRRTH